jgi:hypothetical protein
VQDGELKFEQKARDFILYQFKIHSSMYCCKMANWCKEAPNYRGVSVLMGNNFASNYLNTKACI